MTSTVLTPNPTFARAFQLRLTALAALLGVFSMLHSANAQDTASPSNQTTNTPPMEAPPSPTPEQPAETSRPYAVETNLPPPVASYVPQPMPAPPLAGTSQLAVPSAVALPSVPPLLRAGPVTLQVLMGYRLSYGDGLQATPGQQSKSLIQEIDPGIHFQYGSHWSLDYTPILRFYSSRAFRDTFDNAVNVAGGTTYEDWSFGLVQSYASSSDPIIETASQLDQQTFSTGLNATRQLGSQTSLQLGANQSFRFLDKVVPGQQLSDSKSWSTMDWLNYQFWSRFGAGLGVGFGYDNPGIGGDMTSEQFQGRISWVVVRKLTFVLTGGAEDRQFLGSGAPNLISPIFSLSAQYSPFEFTTLSVGAFRAVSPSFYQNEVTESTSISAGLHQRLFKQVFLDLAGGYSSSTYHASTLVATAAASSYNSTFFSARLGTGFLKRGSADVFYSANYNASGSSVYNNTISQIGFEISYRY